VVDRLRFHLAIGALAAGVALAPAAVEPAAAAAAVTGIALTSLERPRLAAAVVALLLAAVGLGEWRLHAIDRPGERLPAYTQIDERAELLERPRITARGTRAEIRLASGAARGAKVLATAEGPWPGPTEPGTVVRVRGVARPPASQDDAPFDWAAHLRRRGVARELALSEVEATGVRRGGIAGAVDATRRRAEAAIESGLPSDRAALMRGMVLGQDEAIDPLVRDDWRDSGLAHLLVVSGQNVMLLCALAYPFFALTGASPRTRIVVLLILIALYVPLAGAGPSLQRAAVMGGAGLVALASSRPASGAYALLLAAAVTLGLNPRVAGDPGWQLSFAAVAGILAARPYAPRSPVAAAVWLSVVATLATTPLLALHFEAVPLVSVGANLAALPAVAPVMWAGMLQAAVGQLAALGGVGEGAASAGGAALGLVVEPFLAWLDGVAAEAAALPHAVAEVSLSRAVLVAAYVVIVAAFVVTARGLRRAGPRVHEARAVLRVTDGRTLLALAAGGAAALVLVAAPLARPGPPDRLTVSFLDVGQGDATLIQDPAGPAILFDGGPADARVVRLLRQAGVTRLSAVVATHSSADHHGGLLEVLRRFPVDRLLDGGDGTTDPGFRALLREARARGVPVTPARAGQRLRAGPLTVRILSPPLRPPGPAPADPNPRAVVAHVESGGFDLLLSADAESPTLVQLPLPDVDAIKVPHHGSADPGLPAVLRALRPALAVVPVGENSYGHPHPDTLAALRRAVPNVRRTDRDGTVRLSVDGGRMLLD